MGRQESSGSQALSQWSFVLRSSMLFDSLQCLNQPHLPDESFSIRFREAFGPLRGDGGCIGTDFSSNQLLRQQQR